MSDNSISLGNFEAVHELTENDNFHTSIYENDYDGLLIARCNQNGAHPHQVTAILNGLNGKHASAELIAQYASRISQQDAELERLRREISESESERVRLWNENRDLRGSLDVEKAVTDRVKRELSGK